MGVITTFMAFTLIVSLVAVCLATYSINARNRAAVRNGALSGKELYERGSRSEDEGQVRSSGPIAVALKEAGVETSPALWAAGVAASCIVGAAFGFMAGGAGLAVVFGAAVVGGAVAWLARARGRRRKEIAEQFVRLLPQLSASVKSSLTFERAIRVACESAPDPVYGELVVLLAQASYGTPLDRAMQAMAERTGSVDAAALASAMRIQQRFGGSMASVLDLVADHANARMRMERELKTELAGTRLATWFVSCSMPAIFALSWVTNGDFASFYSEEPLGWAVAGGAVLMEVVGIIACRRVTAFKKASLSGA